MKKAVIFYPHIDEYGGIERNIVGLGIKIRKKELSPLLLCFYDHINMKQYNTDLEVIEMGDHWNPLIKSLRLRHWLFKNKKDIAGLPLFFGGKAGFYAAVHQLKPFPYALHFTDPVSLLKGGPQKRGIRKLLAVPRGQVSRWLMSQGVKKASLHLTMTHWNATELKSDYNVEFEVIYQGGVPPEKEILSTPRCAGTTLRLFSICRLTYSKNLDWILHTVDHLRSTEPFNQWYTGIKVVIAGKGPEFKNLKALAQELNLNNLVSFPGFLSQSEAEEEYRQADLFLVPGRQGFGLPILEALYRKLPVVQNRESRVSEMLESSPWVAISENNRESFIEAVASHIVHLRNNYPNEQELEGLRTEDSWATEIGSHCYWWQ